MSKVALVLVAAVAVGTAASAQSDPPPSVATETLTIHYQPEDDLSTPLIIDALAPETVLTIRATGFDGNTTGLVRQCVTGSSRPCRNQLQVRFNDRGAATFQYLVTDAVGGARSDGARCRLGGEPCTIELRVGDKTTIIDTVFVDEAPPPGHLTVTPRRQLLIDDTVTVVASEFPPGTELTVMICAAPATSGSRCGAPGAVVPLSIGRDGTAEAEVALDAAEVGADRVACGRRATCRMVVASDDVGVRARAVTLFFTDSPGADYAPTRVVIGLAVAVALVLFALGLTRSTDWAPPREADSTAIDEAEFADLDLEAAQFVEPGQTYSSAGRTESTSG